MKRGAAHRRTAVLRRLTGMPRTKPSRTGRDIAQEAGRESHETGCLYEIHPLEPIYITGFMIDMRYAIASFLEDNNKLKDATIGHQRASAGYEGNIAV